MFLYVLLWQRKGGGFWNNSRVDKTGLLVHNLIVIGGKMYRTFEATYKKERIIPSESIVSKDFFY